MPVDTNDFAYRFVLEANEKEAQSRRKRAERQERAKNQSPWWGVFFCATLMIVIMARYIHQSDTVMAIIFAVLTIWHISLAYFSWKKRSQ